MNNHRTSTYYTKLKVTLKAAPNIAKIHIPLMNNITNITLESHASQMIHNKRIGKISVIINFVLKMDIMSTNK